VIHSIAKEAPVFAVASVLVALAFCGCSGAVEPGPTPAPAPSSSTADPWNCSGNGDQLWDPCIDAAVFR
jgi:hypothetical protein